MTTFAPANNQKKDTGMDNNKVVTAHLCMLGACVGWGLMAPLGKDAMTHGIDGVSLVTFRVAGGMLLFWLTSLLTKDSEHVPLRDILKFLPAGLLGLVFNQCCYIIGLSYTSPVNASIVVTSMPIFTMLLAALILKEPITGKKVLGIMLGCSGALMLILTSAKAVNAMVGDIRGDMLCLFAQFSFALYLTLFRNFIKRYHVITINKWMFTWATIVIWPFTIGHVGAIDFASVPMSTWWEAGYVIFFGTYLGYICMMIGQKTLRPTVVSVYNYVQPVVSVSVSVMASLAVFKGMQAFAALLIFSGVWLVVKSKSKRDTEKEEQKLAKSEA